MTRRRFYVPRDLIRQDTATLPPGQAHHLRDVLRMRSGDLVEVFDGAGCGYTGHVDIQGPEVFVRGLSAIPPVQSHLRLTLAAALIKPARFEWILEKCTELGVDEIIPLKTRLSEIRIPENRIEARWDRWHRILTEASRQCRRAAAPDLRKPLDFPDFLGDSSLCGHAGFLFYEKTVEPWLPDNFDSDRIILCIGPEGGWDPEEIEQARGAGYQICGLGPWTLRAETAAIAAVSIMQHQINLLKSQASAP